MARAKVLSREEIKRVMRMADCTSNGLRDRVALALSIQAGMRIGEIAALKIGDVRGIDGRAVEVIHLTKHHASHECRAKSCLRVHELHRAFVSSSSWSDSDDHQCTHEPERCRFVCTDAASHP